MIIRSSKKIRSGYSLILALFFIGTAIFLDSCGAAKDKAVRSPEEAYNKAVKLFEEEDYLQAQEQFDVIKLQYPASKYADDAQYYLSEIYFRQKQYIMAAFNFNRIRSLYPNSPYTKEALYKACLCYYNLSPSFDRDQEYTNKAIETMNTFQRIYPQDSLYAEVDTLINEMRNKLAHREYSIAEIYRKLDSPNSSLIYYDSVIENYPDTIYFERAYIGKIEALTIMKRFGEAKGIIELYKKRFPSGEYKDRVEQLKDDIEQ